MELQKGEFNYKEHVIFLVSKEHSLRDLGLAEKEIFYAREKVDLEKYHFFFNHFDKKIFIAIVDPEQDLIQQQEKARKLAQKICALVNSEKIEQIQFVPQDVDKRVALAFIEGLMLSNYKFLKYITKDLDKKKNTLNSLIVISDKIEQGELDKLQATVEGVYIARDLVNEPYPSLNSENLPEHIKQLAEQAGFEVEVLGVKQIEALKMGGLLAVNRGSQYKPSFSILTWKPKEAEDMQPVVLVGKGIVFDSGGLNLKPTGYIEDMKSDMAGAAAVVGTIYAAAKMNLPVYLIGLIPSTDNAISDRSYAPGEIITIHNGMTVEVRNTDAEGRLILADALSYAKKYNPKLVIDMATLTGSAMRALGPFASAMFAKTERHIAELLIDSSEETYERVVEFPLWDEYKEMLTSDIADVKNIGGSNAGLITAAKFLEYFTDYPWIHLDIAPTAYLTDNKDYRGKGATGYAVRLLLNFLQKIS